MHLQLCYSVLHNNDVAEQSHLGNVSERVRGTKLKRSLFGFRTFFQILSSKSL